MITREGKNQLQRPRNIWITVELALSSKACTVKRVDEVVRHPHLVTHDQFTQVSKKVSDIPEENFTINIKLFQPNFTFVELLRYKHIPHVELFRWWPSNLSICFTNVELLDKGWLSQNWRQRGAILHPTIHNLQLYHCAMHALYIEPKLLTLRNRN